MFSFQSLQSVVSSVGNFIGGAYTATSAYTLKKVSLSDYAKATLIEDGDFFKLYKMVKPEVYECILSLGSLGGKLYSVFRLPDIIESQQLHRLFEAKLPTILQSVGASLDKATLQTICDSVRSHQGWISAHHAAHAGLEDAFRDNLIVRELNETCAETLATPLHVAVQAEQVGVIRLLLQFPHTRFDIADINGDTVFHFAARVNDHTIMELLCRTKTPIINQANEKQENPLHLAVALGRQDLIQPLLAGGADSSIPGPEGIFPIHLAVKDGSIDCVRAILTRDLKQIKAKDGKYGGSPLHWSASSEVVDYLLDAGADVNAFSETTETPLHILVRKCRLGPTLTLLSRRPEAVDQRGPDGNTPLHLAVMAESLELTRALIVFGADLTKTNDKGETARHLAGAVKGVLGDILVYTLHAVGASRCNASMTFCTDSCHHSKISNGSHPVDGPHVGQRPEDPHYDAPIVKAAVERIKSELQSVSNLPNGMTNSDRLLCLDGGGIRGLVLILMLQALQDRLSMPLRDAFDWIAGTSTGGILALALLVGKTPVQALGLYLRFKNQIFVGGKPYNAEKLERFLADEFGESTTMMAFKKPRVIVTAVLGDRKPAELHLFRNYDPPKTAGDTMMHVAEMGGAASTTPFLAIPSPAQTLVWKAARSSGAAPTYFRPMGRFLDGGLMANNPTLDALTEIHKWHVAKGMLPPPRPSVVVSLGTGRPPIVPVKTVDVFMPESLFSMETAKAMLGAKNLGTILVEQATAADGQPVDRSRAWLSSLSVPFFRLSPRLSEDIPLDTNDDKLLIKMMWETKAYIHANSGTFQDIALLLSRDPATLCRSTGV